MEKKIIKIAATEDIATGFLFFECPFCSKTHRHGSGWGRRGSHCSKYRGEYELVPMEELIE